MKRPECRQRKCNSLGDNLNTHKEGVDFRWKKFNVRHNNKFIFHDTPIHSSWVNQIEIFFSILQKTVIRYGSFLSEEDLREKVMKYMHLWNSGEGHSFNWEFDGYT